MVIFAPSPGSLNALATLELCRRLGVPVAGVVLRRFTLGRFRDEWRRHGPRLLRKIRRQLILGGDEHADPADTSLGLLVRRLDPGTRDLRRLAGAMGAPVRRVDDFGDVAGDPAVTGFRIGLFTGGGILPRPLLEALEAGVVNVHTGHLPGYRGMDGVPAALLEGRPASVGLTAHYMTPAIDRGDVLTRLTVDPGRYPTAGALHNALAGLMPLMLVDAALGIGSGRLSRTPQPAGGRRHYVMHPRLRALVDECLVRRHATLGLAGPSPARRTLDAACRDLKRQAGGSRRA
ncbi:MAG: formyltransferase family protein [Acidobacteria bacterium]|nr:formyltransferase family protein [Acidobacteriota bacterium]